MSPVVVVGLLTLLLGIQPITTDLYLPALPTLTHELNASVSVAQLTLSALIICFGLGQLVFGPLSDRYGRRPLLIAGMSLYTVASVFSAAATSIEWLIFWRALQGAAMAAAVMTARSVVRDLYAPHEGAAVLSRALTGLGVIAMLSPLTGGLIVQWLNWHAVLSVVAVFGALTLSLVIWKFTETVPQRNPHATRLRPMLANWREVLSNPTFRAWALLSSLTYGGIFVVLASSSFVFTEALGRSRLEMGTVLLSCSLSYTLGTVLCRRLLPRLGLRGTVAIGGALSLAGGLTMAVLSLIGVSSMWAIVIPLWVYAIAHGLHQPCGHAGAVGPFPEKAGTAASLSGFITTVVAFAAGLVLGRSLNGTVFPLTLGLGFFSIGIALVAWTLVQRHGDPRAGIPVFLPTNP